MATRKIRVIGDPVLTKQCRKVDKITPRIRQLIGDMIETLYEAEGVGLAAPQVGVLRRIMVIDTSADTDDKNPLVFINPEIIETEGEQIGSEGCLSVPDKFGEVTRPMRVKVRAYDADMNEFTMEGEELFARAVCHECDHLDGILYTTKLNGELKDVSAAENEGEEEA